MQAPKPSQFISVVKVPISALNTSSYFGFERRLNQFLVVHLLPHHAAEKSFPFLLTNCMSCGCLPFSGIISKEKYYNSSNVPLWKMGALL